MTIALLILILLAILAPGLVRGLFTLIGPCILGLIVHDRLFTASPWTSVRPFFPFPGIF
jgi:hypothetical protein